ncbi:MAG: 50S ribosomal protein L11 [bacterium JZ-2024 1]
MATKPVKAVVKFQIPGGQASPAPPIGPALSPHGVNIMNFCKEFNEKTKGQQGIIVPVVLTVFVDRTYHMELKTPPAAVLIRMAAGIEKGAGDPKRQKVGRITRKQAEEIARQKKNDLNTDSLEAAVRIIEGTARSMGVEVVEQ